MAESERAIGGIIASLWTHGSDPQTPPSRRETEAPVKYIVTLDHMSVPAKWHLTGYSIQRL